MSSRKLNPIVFRDNDLLKKSHLLIDMPGPRASWSLGDEAGRNKRGLERGYLRKARKFCGLLAEPNISGRKGRYETCN
jgi:hypothetical protein